VPGKTDPGCAGLLASPDSNTVLTDVTWNVSSCCNPSPV